MHRRRCEEARKTALDRLTEKLEAHADEILDTYLEAIPAGDWRTAEALYVRVYGKSKQRHEVEASTGPIPPEELATWSEEKIEAWIKELEAESGPESEEDG